MSDKMYIMTPRTRILTVAKEHSMVFMIDLSSSLATIEPGTGKVMIGSAYDVYVFQLLEYMNRVD